MLKATLMLATLALLASSAWGQQTRVLPEGYKAGASPPFSSGLMAGGAFYVAGTIGLDPATNMAAQDVDAEIHFMLDGVKDTLQKGGLKMEDLVSVTIYCTDLALYDKFNAIYRTYFPSGEFPPRAFIGVNKLVRNARFEVQGVAVKSKAASKH